MRAGRNHGTKPEGLVDHGKVLKVYFEHHWQPLEDFEQTLLGLHGEETFGGQVGNGELSWEGPAGISWLQCLDEQGELRGM